MYRKDTKREHSDSVSTPYVGHMNRKTSRRRDGVPRSFLQMNRKNTSEETKEVDSDEEAPTEQPQFLETKSGSFVNSYFDRQSSTRREKEAKSCRRCVMTHAREFFKLIGVVMGGPLSAITYSEKLANVESCACLEDWFRTIRAFGVLLTQTIVIILVYMFTESRTLQKVVFVVSCTYTILYVTLMLIAEFESRTAILSWDERMWGKWLISQKLHDFVNKDTEEPSFSNDKVKVSEVTTQDLLKECIANIQEYGRRKSIESDRIVEAQTKIRDKLCSDYQPLRRRSRKLILAFFSTSVQDVTGSTSAWLIPSFCITISVIAAVIYANIQITIDNDDDAFSTIARVITAGGLIYRVSSLLVELIISTDYDCIDLIYPSRTDLAIARKLVAPILKNLEENQITLRGKIFNTTEQIEKAYTLINSLQEKLLLPGKDDQTELVMKIQKSKRELRSLNVGLQKEWKSIGEINRQSSVLRKRKIRISKSHAYGSADNIITRTSPTGSNYYAFPSKSGGRDSVQLTTTKSAPVARHDTKRRGTQPDSLGIPHAMKSVSNSALTLNLETEDGTIFSSTLREPSISAELAESDMLPDFENFNPDTDYLSPGALSLYDYGHSDALTPSL